MGGVVDAIDIVRAELAAHAVRLERIEGVQERLSIDIDNALGSIHAKMAVISETVAASGATQSVQIVHLRDIVFSLTNQVAIVAATLGSAIDALKQGDAEASGKALNDALSMQDRLGHMIDDLRVSS